MCLETWACSLLACYSQEKWTKSYWYIIFFCNCAFLCTIFALSFYAFQWGPILAICSGKAGMKLPILLTYHPVYPAGPASRALCLPVLTTVKQQPPYAASSIPSLSLTDFNWSISTSLAFSISPSLLHALQRHSKLLVSLKNKNIKVPSPSIFLFH